MALKVTMFEGSMDEFMKQLRDHEEKCNCDSCQRRRSEMKEMITDYRKRLVDAKQIRWGAIFSPAEEKQNVMCDGGDVELQMVVLQYAIARHGKTVFEAWDAEGLSGEEQMRRRDVLTHLGCEMFMKEEKSEEAR